jgi:hypothetical protein
MLLTGWHMRPLCFQDHDCHAQVLHYLRQTWLSTCVLSTTSTAAMAASAASTLRPTQGLNRITAGAAVTASLTQGWVAGGVPEAVACPEATLTAAATRKISRVTGVDLKHKAPHGLSVAQALHGLLVFTQPRTGCKVVRQGAPGLGWHAITDTLLQTCTDTGGFPKKCAEGSFPYYM